MVDQFATKATDWDNNSVRREMTKKFINIIRKHTQIKPATHVLDFGCGTGMIGLHFAPEAEKVKMVDTSPAMLEVLMTKIQDAGHKNVHVYPHDIEKTEEHNNIIVSLMTLHHVDNHIDILRKFYQKLHEDGLVIIGDLMPEDGSFHSPEIVPHNGIHPKTLSRLCQKVGFEVEWCYKFHSIHKKTEQGSLKSYDMFVLVARKPKSR